MCKVAPAWPCFHCVPPPGPPGPLPLPLPSTPPQNKLFDIIKAGQYEFDEADWKDISAEAKDLIRHMLVCGLHDVRVDMVEDASLSPGGRWLAWPVVGAGGGPIP